MKCFCCDKDLPDGAAFCPSCGAPAGQTSSPVAHTGDEAWREHATEAENAAVQGTKVSPNVYLGTDGKYRWVYELNLSKNPTVRRMIQKIMGIVMGICFVLLSGISVIINGFSLGDLLPGLMLWLIVSAVIEAAILITMPIVSLVYRRSYWTIYEMDEERITQVQMKRTFDRSRVLGLLLLLTSDDMVDAISARNLATQDYYHSYLNKVRTIKITPKWDYIFLGGALTNCPMYAPPEDYDFVLSYILDHVPAETAAKFHAKYG